jgi:hypothetical protein
LGGYVAIWRKKQMLEEFLQDYTPEASGLSASASDLPADLADCLAELGIRSFRSGLFLTVDPSISDELLNDWRWLVPVDALVWARSAFGDLFLYLPNEAEPVSFLDTMGGTVQTLGPSVAAVLNTTFLRDDFKDEKLLSYLRDELQSAGRIAGGSTCFSFRRPIKLGGKIDATNIDVCDLITHCAIQGQLLSQLKDLPAGTPVKNIQIVAPATSAGPKRWWKVW